MCHGFDKGKTVTGKPCHNRLPMDEKGGQVVQSGTAGVKGTADIMTLLLRMTSNMMMKRSPSRTCEIQIENRTGVELNNVKWYEHCGRASGNPPPPSIQPQATKQVNFSKSFGFLGCAGLLSYQYCENERFVIAFRVPMVQVRKRAKNSFAIASMVEAKDMNCDMYKNMMYEWNPVQQPTDFDKSFAADNRCIQITTNGVTMKCTMSRDNNAGICFEIYPTVSYADVNKIVDFS